MNTTDGEEIEDPEPSTLQMSSYSRRSRSRPDTRGRAMLLLSSVVPKSTVSPSNSPAVQIVPRRNPSQLIASSSPIARVSILWKSYMICLAFDFELEHGSFAQLISSVSSWWLVNVCCTGAIAYETDYMEFSESQYYLRFITLNNCCLWSNGHWNELVGWMSQYKPLMVVAVNNMWLCDMVDTNEGMAVKNVREGLLNIRAMDVGDDQMAGLLNAVAEELKARDH